MPIKPQGLDCQFVFERSTGGTVPSFLRDISFYKRPKGGKGDKNWGGTDTTEGWMEGVTEEGWLVRESVLPTIFN